MQKILWLNDLPRNCHQEVDRLSEFPLGYYTSLQYQADIQTNTQKKNFDKVEKNLRFAILCVQWYFLSLIIDVVSVNEYYKIEKLRGKTLIGYKEWRIYKFFPCKLFDKSAQIWWIFTVTPINIQIEHFEFSTELNSFNHLFCIHPVFLCIHANILINRDIAIIENLYAPGVSMIEAMQRFTFFWLKSIFPHWFAQHLL